MFAAGASKAGVSCNRRRTLTPMELKKDWQLETTIDAIASGVTPANAFPVDKVHVFVDDPIFAMIVMEAEIVDRPRVAVKVID